uniref:C2H2-type domain-containing protein n=1 Tax=viral metagenome TaxID=1070528 RepID=A0A6C0AZS5_9ZZZZ
MNPNKKTPENAFKFICKECDFGCCKESDFNRHLLTRKHKILTNPNARLTKNAADSNFQCPCGKSYKHMSSLCNHKKKCSMQTNLLHDNTSSSNNIVSILLNQNMELIKQNQEFKDLIMDQNKKILEIARDDKVTNNTTNNTTNNFNLNFFLNEQCKDALNIMEFVNTIKLQLSDLDMMGKLGYTEGISKIFIRGLKELDIFKRPIHCSDLKRETLYIKDKDAWEKENSENMKIKQAINYIANKNIKQIPTWVKENPTSEDTETKKHMDYVHILHESMGGSSTESDLKKYNKIIRNVAKEVVIDKEKI